MSKFELDELDVISLVCTFTSILGKLQPSTQYQSYTYFRPPSDVEEEDLRYLVRYNRSANDVQIMSTSAYRIYKLTYTPAHGGCLSFEVENNTVPRENVWITVLEDVDRLGEDEAFYFQKSLLEEHLVYFPPEIFALIRNIYKEVYALWKARR